MAAAHDVISAFKSGSGVSASIAHDVIVTTLCALTLIWLTWSVFRIGAGFLDNQITRGQAIGYVIRSAVLTCLVVFSLLQ